MLKKLLAGIIVVTFAVVALEAQGAQFPTPEKYAASAQTQQHVANAMKIAGGDLQAEARAFCTAVSRAEASSG